MLILGDSGAGKSTFNRHLEHQLWQEYKAGGPIPLFINLPALDRPGKDLVVEQLRILDFPEEHIWDMKENRRFVLICDGYDESQLTCNLHTTNHLNQTGQWSAKLVITCRTQYLGQNYRDRFEPQGGTHYDSSAPGLFKESVIAPFSKDQIEEYVERYVPLEPRTWVKEDFMDKLTTIPGLMGLVKNPFLLTLALGALPTVVNGQRDLSRVRITRVQLYESFVQHWLSANRRRLQNLKVGSDEQRMIDELLDNGFEEDVIKFQMDLSAAIFHEQEGRSIVYYTPKNDKNSWKAVFFNTNPETSLLRGASLLVRAGSQYRFVHRSILEYFYSCTICPSSTIAQFAPQACSVSIDALESIADHPLSKRNLVKEPSIVRFLSERAQLNTEFKRQLHALLERSKTDERASQAAANAITILVRAGVPFNGVDLRGVRVPGADLSGGQFDSAQLQGADLTETNLTRIWLRQAGLSDARMEDVQFGELPCLVESVFSPCGKQIASFSDDKSRGLQFIQYKMDRLIKTVFGGVFTSGAYSLDGLNLALGGTDGSIRLFDTQTKAYGQAFVSKLEAVACVAYSSDGRRIVSGHVGGSLHLWEVAFALVSVFTGHWADVKSIVFSPDSSQLASCSWDYTVRLWETNSSGSGHDSHVTSISVSSVAYSSDGRHLIVGSKDSSVQQYDAERGDPSVIRTGGSYQRLNVVAFTPDGLRVATSWNSNDIQARGIKEGTDASILQGHTAHVLSVAFSPCGNWIASGSVDRTVRLWDAHSGTLIQTLAGHSDWVKSVSFSPSGSRLVSSSTDATIRVWDVRTVESRVINSAGYLAIEAVTYSPNGQQIAGIVYKDVRLWDEQTGELQHTLTHERPVTCMAFSSCGQWLTTGGDRSICLWFLDPNEVPQQWRWLLVLDSLQRVVTIAWRPNTVDFVTGFQDGSTRTWRLQSESDELSIQMLWSAGPAIFNAVDAVISGTVGLSAINRQLLLQRGAIEGGGKLSSEAD
ncbi:U3 snoRNP protein [Linnemannia gamsii]|uniref:U3 snoRNP protein n=1 Tax=Linnemannia gamsii TaxID=64522 RepID=A0A9P6QPW3_9FUNG|nr:U3 snoRNP protein [Linnemannia gamsii]